MKARVTLHADSILPREIFIIAIIPAEKRSPIYDLLLVTLNLNAVDGFKYYPSY